jgi:ribosome recycling factor
MPLNQIAQIHAPEPQMITVQPFDTSQLGSDRKGHPQRRPRPQSDE